MLESYRPLQQETNSQTSFLIPQARQLLPNTGPNQSRMAEVQGLYGLVFNWEILEPRQTTIGGQTIGCDQPNHECIAIWCSSACDGRGPERHT